MQKKTALVLLPAFWPNLPPVALAALKGFLSAQNVRIDTLDFNNVFFNLAGKELQKEWLRSRNPVFENTILEILESTTGAAFNSMIQTLQGYDIIGFSCFESNFPTIKKIAHLLKLKRPDISIIFGGPEIASQYFRHKENIIQIHSGIADLIVVGEGELPLLQYITEGTRNAGLVLFNELDDLSALPPPDFSCFDFNTYPKKKEHFPCVLARMHTLLRVLFRTPAAQEIQGFPGKKHH